MKPTIRLIHNLARSGSTLICKCLGCMERIDLLSEIHPAACRLFNPLQQAHEWFGLLNEDDIAVLNGDGPRPTFVNAIAVAELRARERGEYLVVRDWAHLDFTGVPFLERPTGALQTADALREDFSLLQLFTVRHPIDQWLSLSRLDIMRQEGGNRTLTLEGFLSGYRQFAELAVAGEWVRYEDFTADPIDTMQRICTVLQLPYDPSFIDKWHQYQTITGDVQSTRGGNTIKSLPRREINHALQQRFDNDVNYQEICRMLEY